jgi:hypothetical protein
VDLTPFAHGVPLGQLASVAVYCSDVRCGWAERPEWAGKAHGPGCQHHKQLRGDDDLLILGEWTERLSQAAQVPSGPPDGCVCSRCGGFAIRRLSVVELRYWCAAHEVYEAGKDIAACEQHLAGVCDPRRELEPCDRALRSFTRIGVVLGRYEDEPALAEYVKDLRVRHEALTRRADTGL